MTPHELAARHAQLLGEQLPGAVRGVYLVGSVALGDHRPGISDIDTLTVTERTLDDSDAEAALRAVHGCLAPDLVGVCYDTTYIPVDWLADAPDAGAVTPFSLDGELHVHEAAFQVSPPTWLELAGGVAVSGPAPSDLDIADVSEPLREWTIQNLKTYWDDSATRMRQVLVERPAGQEAKADVVVWHALGAPRLHATLATNQIISKTDAGEYAADLWPEFADLAFRSMAWRAGEAVTFRTVDGLAAADLVDAVVADATGVRS